MKHIWLWLQQRTEFAWWAPTTAGCKRVTLHTRQQHRIIQAHLLNFLKILEDKSQIRRFSFSAARAVPQRHARRFSWPLVSSNVGQRPCHGHAAPSTLRFQRHSPPNSKPPIITRICTFLAPPAAALLLIAVAPNLTCPTSFRTPPAVSRNSGMYVSVFSSFGCSSGC